MEVLESSPELMDPKAMMTMTSRMMFAVSYVLRTSTWIRFRAELTSKRDGAYELMIGDWGSHSETP
jgi:hypothetical protein